MVTTMDFTPDMVTALENDVKVPFGTLGVLLGTYKIYNDQGWTLLYLVDWYLNQPGRPTRRAMLSCEFQPIEEG